MDTKKRTRLVIILSVVVALVISGLIIFCILTAGGSAQGSGDAVSPHLADASAAVGEAGPSCAFDFLVGLPAGEAQTQIASQGRPIRVLGPDSMATQDYSAERINLMTDENGIVQSVNCQ